MKTLYIDAVWDKELKLGKEVLEHLEHIKIALHGGLVIIPALCLGCGFSFRKRERLKKPGRCPVCRSERIVEPSFSIS